MSRRIYHKLEDGEWWRPVATGAREQCCDCGLVHKLDFRIVDGRIEIRATRDMRATAAVRRAFRFDGEK